MTGARELAAALGGRWNGRYGVAACPVCQAERRRDQAALSIGTGDGGRLLLRCFKSDCAFADITAAAGLRSGDWRRPDPAAVAERERAARAEGEKRAEQARTLWHGAGPIGGTAAETYLRGRGITCALPRTLRFHPEAWHGRTARRLPAMVAEVQGAFLPAVHRTFIRPDGAGKAGLEGGDKLMLGATTGGAVRLAEGPGALVVAEGIETALSLACGLLGAPATIWAALSASELRALRLPPVAGRLIIAADGDPAGRAGAHDLAERAHGMGWQVGILDPGDGLDFNDVLTGKAVAA